MNLFKKKYAKGIKAIWYVLVILIMVSMVFLFGGLTLLSGGISNLLGT